MFCMNCGQELPDKAKFCMNCGNQNSDFEEISTASEAQEQGDYIITLKGVEIDFLDIYQQCDRSMAKVVARIRGLTGVSPNEASELAIDMFRKIQNNTGSSARIIEDYSEPKCPKCGSRSLSANKKGFGVGKAVAGMILTGGLAGAAAGGIGANKIRITCLKCGHQFQAGKK